MPTYDYKCENCGASDTAERSMKDSETPHECLQCGEYMKRTFGFSAVTFNGNGFYRTDK